MLSHNVLRGLCINARSAGIGEHAGTGDRGHMEHVDGRAGTGNEKHIEPVGSIAGIGNEKSIEYVDSIAGTGDEKNLEYVEEAEVPLIDRVVSLETSLHELGGHFVKYQQDVASILVSECVRLETQMRDSKTQIQRTLHSVVQDTVAGAKEQILAQIHRFVLQENMIREDSFSTQATTTATSEDSEAYAELLRLSRETRKNMIVLQDDLNVHRSSIERRFEDLETRVQTQEEFTGGSQVESLVQRLQPMLAGMTQNILHSLKDAAEKNILPEKCPKRESAEECAGSQASLARSSSSVTLGSAAIVAGGSEASATPKQPQVLFLPAKRITPSGNSVSGMSTSPSDASLRRLPSSPGNRSRQLLRVANSPPKSLGSFSESIPNGAQPGSSMPTKAAEQFLTAGSPAQSQVLFWPAKATGSNGNTIGRVSRPSSESGSRGAKAGSQYFEEGSLRRSNPVGRTEISPGPGSVRVRVNHGMGNCSPQVDARPRVLQSPSTPRVGGTPIRGVAQGIGTSPLRDTREALPVTFPFGA